MTKVAGWMASGTELRSASAAAVVPVTDGAVCCRGSGTWALVTGFENGTETVPEDD